MTYVLHFYEWHALSCEYFPVPGAKSGQPGKLTTCRNLWPVNTHPHCCLLNLPHIVSEEQNAFICILVSLTHLKSVILTHFHIAASLLLHLIGNLLPATFLMSAGLTLSSLSDANCKVSPPASPDQMLPLWAAAETSVEAKWSFGYSATMQVETTATSSMFPTNAISSPS